MALVVTTLHRQVGQPTLTALPIHASPCYSQSSDGEQIR